MLALLALFACQDPFGTDRHVLEDFRVAALSAPVEDGVTRPSAALVVDGRLWSDEPVEQRWYWVDDPDLLASPDDLEPAAVGPAPELALGDAAYLGLVARAPDGTERAAFLAPAGPALPELDVALSVLPLDVDAVDFAALEPDARATLVAEPAESVPVGAFARLIASPEVALTRWMATAGTFFELDPVTADWAAGVVTLDDEEVVGAEPLGAGVVAALVIGLEDGRTTWDAVDLAVGGPPVGAWVDGRFFPADAQVEPGEVLATLVADDDAPSGLRLGDVAPLGGASWGTDGLCAAEVAGPFDPDWLVDGRCARADVVGARVGLVVGP